MGRLFNMTKIGDRPVERRRYIRLFVPIGIIYTNLSEGKIHNADTKDISAEGVRFEAADKLLNKSDLIELRLNIPGAPNPVHTRGRVMWKEKLTLEDNSPFDFGVEFLEIEEDNKNTFLKFLCDLIYNLPEGIKHAGKKKD